MQNGKGDSPRPIDRDRFDRNFDEIKWNDRSSGDCKSCEVGCGHFKKTGMVCFPRQIEPESQSIRLREEGEQVSQDTSE